MPSMTSATYPHVYAVRLTPADHAKLQALADQLEQTPSQLLRLLIRRAQVPAAVVTFTDEQYEDGRRS
jgi:hypothetical protein